MATPRMTALLSIRQRFQFTTNLLPTLIRGAERSDHEYLLCVDRVPAVYEFNRRPGDPADLGQRIEADKRSCAEVDRWIDAHADLLSRYGVRVVVNEDDPNAWTGGLRSASALNRGLAQASCEWVVAFGDEDLCFRRGWDSALWAVLEGRDPMRTVAVCTYVKVNNYDGDWPRPWSAEWIHATRKRCCHALLFPIAPGLDAFNARITERTWHAYADAASQGGVHEEPCGVRDKCQWVPMIMHRDLLRRMGGWRVEDARAFSYDIAIDDDLMRAGVVKRMPLDHHVLDSKFHLYIDDEIDKEWGHPSHLAQSAHAVMI